MIAGPRRQIGIVEVVVFDKRYGGLGRLDVLVAVGDGYFLSPWLHSLHVFAHDDVGTHPHGASHYQSEAHLAYDLELAAHAVLVVTLHLEPVVGKSESSEPYGGQQHQSHVDAAEIAHEQAGHEYGDYYDDASHGGGAFFLHLSFKAEITHDLSDLHQLQAVDDAAAEYHGDKQRQHEGGS